MQKIRVHVGGEVILGIPDGLEPGMDGYDAALSDAWADIANDDLFALMGDEWVELGLHPNQSVKANGATWEDANYGDE